MSTSRIRLALHHFLDSGASFPANVLQEFRPCQISFALRLLTPQLFPAR